MHVRIPWSLSVLSLTVALGWFTFELTKNWINFAEAQLQSTMINDQMLALQRMEIRQRMTDEK